MRSLEGDVLLATAPPGAEIRCPVQSVTRLEASTGRRRRGWKPVLLGLGLGTTAGLVVGLAVEGRVAASQGVEPTGLLAGLTWIGLTGVGLVAGVVVGLTHTEGWREVEMPLPLFVFRSRDGRTGVGFSVPLRR